MVIAFNYDRTQQRARRMIEKYAYFAVLAAVRDLPTVSAWW